MNKENERVEQKEAEEDQHAGSKRKSKDQEPTSKPMEENQRIEQKEAGEDHAASKHKAKDEPASRAEEENESEEKEAEEDQHAGSKRKAKEHEPTSKPKEEADRKYDSDAEYIGTSDEDRANSSKSKKAKVAEGKTRGNANRHITEILSRLSELYSHTGDQFRSLAYQRASSVLSTLPHITNVSQVKDLRGIGKSIQDKIQEILNTGHLKLLDNLEKDPRVKAKDELANIWGIGPKTAESLMKHHGIKSVKDLETRGKHLLTAQQQIGLDRHEELSKRIPRAEMERAEKLVEKHAQRLMPGVECTICGSYRRGEPDSSDIDVLICPPEGTEEIHILPKLIEELHDVCFLTDDLTHPKPEHSNDRASYMGICKLPEEGSLHRRIDIKTYPRSMRPFALLYFTGPNHFNRSMRHYADKKGFTLSDQSLHRAVHDGSHHDEKHSVGKPIPCTTERDIFEVLGLPYYEPNDRNRTIAPPTASSSSFK